MLHEGVEHGIGDESAVAVGRRLIPGDREDAAQPGIRAGETKAFAVAAGGAVERLADAIGGARRRANGTVRG